MSDYLSLTVKCVYLSGCDMTKQMNDILSSQSVNFVIHDIQMVVERGSHYAWIFYQGTYPEELKE